MCDFAGISLRTAEKWRMKLFACFCRFPEEAVLFGDIWIDEIYVSIPASRRVSNRNLSELRWISRNKKAVCLGTDSEHSAIEVAAGRGHLSSKEVMEAYVGRIARGSHLIHDGFHGHGILVSSLGLSETVCSASRFGSEEALQPINPFCSYIKTIIALHIGVTCRNLHGCLDWACFKIHIRDMPLAERIRYVLDYCLNH